MTQDELVSESDYRELTVDCCMTCSCAKRTFLAPLRCRMHNNAPVEDLAVCKRYKTEFRAGGAVLE
jgi:hypothetical protein